MRRYFSVSRPVKGKKPPPKDLSTRVYHIRASPASSGCGQASGGHLQEAGPAAAMGVEAEPRSRAAAGGLPTPLAIWYRVEGRCSARAYRCNHHNSQTVTFMSQR